MGLERKVKKKTILALVFDLVKERIKQITKKSVDLFIFEFFKFFGSINNFNPYLNTEYDYNLHQRYFLRILFLKAILPIRVLRTLNLLPPEGINLDFWLCAASPCSSGTRFKCQDFRLIGKIREFLGHPDSLPQGYFNSFEQVWGAFQRKRSGETCNGSFSPLMLFPVRDFPDHAKEKVRELFKFDEDNIDSLNYLFLCPDHIGNKGSAKSVLKLRSDSVFNYSPEYVDEALRRGQAFVRVGRKGYKTLTYLPTLISLCKNKPSFASPLPANSETLAVVKSVIMANNLDLENILSHATVSFGGEYPG